MYMSTNAPYTELDDENPGINRIINITFRCRPVRNERRIHHIFICVE